MTQLKPEFRYHAFISYRNVSSDQHWAKWLHSAIENYSVPKKLRKEYSLPKYIRPVFRDVDELAASSDLNESITNALQQSRSLIVVCSPRTPDSRWVNAEITHFQKLGRDKQIFPLLIEGEPINSFPSVLLKTSLPTTSDQPSVETKVERSEPLAADVRPTPDQSARYLKRMAKLRIIAGILGCEFDALRQRDKERRRRNFTIASLVSSLIVSCILLIGIKSFHRAWDGQIMASHWPPGESGNVPLQLTSDESTLISGALFDGPYTQMWDVRTGTPIDSRINSYTNVLAPNGRFLLASSDGGYYYFDLRTKEKRILPVRHNFHQLAQFVNPDIVMIYHPALQTSARLEFWSLADYRKIGEIIYKENDYKVGTSSAALGSSSGAWMNDDGTRLVVPYLLDDKTGVRIAPFLWDTQTGRRLNVLSMNNSEQAYFAVNNRQSVIVTVEVLNETEAVIALWNMADGRLIQPKTLTRPKIGDLMSNRVSFAPNKLKFSSDDNLLFIGGSDESLSTITILGLPGLTSDSNASADSRGWWIGDPAASEPFLLLSGNSQDTWLWNLKQETRTLLRGFDAARADQVLVSRDGFKAVVLRGKQEIELWDLNNGVSEKRIHLPTKVEYIRKAIAGRAFYIKSEDENQKIFLHSFQTLEQIAEISGAGFGSDFKLFYDFDCNRINVWATVGSMWQFKEHAEIFGRPIWMLSCRG